MQTQLIRDKDIKIFNIIFFSLAIISLPFEIFGIEIVAQIGKILCLMIMLSLYWLQLSSYPSAFIRILLCALISTLLGDIITIFNLEKDPLNTPYKIIIICYILRNFLLAIAYSWNTYKSELFNPPLVRMIALLPWVFCGIIIYYTIVQGNAEYFSYLLIYDIIANIFGITATIRINHTSFKSWYFSVFGSVAFLFSDILLYYETFDAISNPFADELRFLLYIGGVYFIVISTLDHVAVFKAEFHEKIYHNMDHTIQPIKSKKHIIQTSIPLIPTGYGKIDKPDF